MAARAVAGRSPGHPGVVCSGIPQTLPLDLRRSASHRLRSAL